MTEAPCVACGGTGWRTVPGKDPRVPTFSIPCDRCPEVSH